MTIEADRPPLFDRTELHAAALAVLEESAKRQERWLVAFSGGADSLALFLTISALWPQQRSHLIAAHFNHSLRGSESDADERFCAKVAHDRGVEFLAARWSQLPTEASEAEARAARFEFFSRVALEKDCRVLLTGHQLDDVIETFFMRFARGASSAGLAAPRPVRGWNDEESHPFKEQSKRWIVRPLLSQAGETIRSRLTEAGVSWREDASNRQADFLRNRIRHDVVPNWLQAAGASARAGAALTRALLEEDDTALESWLDELGIEKVVTRLPLATLSGKPRALIRRALRRWCGSDTFSRTGFDGLIALVESGRGRISAGEGWACIEDGFLVWRTRSGGAASPTGCVDVLAPALVYLPDGAQIGIRALHEIADWKERLAAKKIDSSREVLLEISRTPNSWPLTIRFWQPGDRYAPLGLGGSAKVQDLFVNRKIDPLDRHRLPIIVGPDGQIVWIPGFAPAEDCRLTSDSRWGVQLTYLAGTSTVSPQSLFL